MKRLQDSRQPDGKRGWTLGHVGTCPAPRCSGRCRLSSSEFPRHGPRGGEDVGWATRGRSGNFPGR